MSQPRFGDTVPGCCPKCDYHPNDPTVTFKFAGWNAAWGYNEWHCQRCGYRHGEDPMDKRHQTIARVP